MNKSLRYFYMYKGYYSRNNVDTHSHSQPYPQPEPPVSRPHPSYKAVYNPPPARIPLNEQSTTHKLHETFKPSYLGIDEYQHQTEYVNTDTIRHLDVASKTIHEIDEIMPYGAGNQWLNIIATQGESEIRCDMLRAKFDEVMWKLPEQEESVKSMTMAGLNLHLSRQYQAGNCYEMSIMAHHKLITQGLNAPLLTFTDDKRDHVYTLIGDPRDRKWGEKNTVVVDAWPIYKTTYTLKHALYNLESRPRIILEYPASTPSPDSINAFFHEKYPILNTTDVDQHLARNNLPPVGNEYLKYCHKNCIPGYPRDERVGTRDPSIRYTDGYKPRRTFDDISEDLLSRYNPAFRIMTDS